MPCVCLLCSVACGAAPAALVVARRRAANAGGALLRAATVWRDARKLLLPTRRSDVNMIG